MQPNPRARIVISEVAVIEICRLIVVLTGESQVVGEFHAVEG